MLLSWKEASGAARPVIAICLACGMGLVLLSTKRPSTAHLSTFYVLMLIAFSIGHDFSPFHLINDIFVRFLLIFAAHMSFLVLPSFKKDENWRSSGSVLDDDCEEHGLDDEARDWKFAYKMLFNARCVGTPMAAPSVSHLTKRDDLLYRRKNRVTTNVEAKNAKPSSSSQKSFIKSKSKWTFICRQSAILFLRYLAMCLYYDETIYRYTPDGLPWTASDFTPQKATFPRRVPGLICPSYFSHSPFTTRELIIRTHHVLERILSDYLLLSAYHDILAIVAVLSGLDDPQEWPPLFGNITQAYTVRRYWSHFWHHLIYRSFSAWAALFTSKLAVSRKYKRYLNNAIVFVMSGVMHVLVDWRLSEEGGKGCGLFTLGNWYVMQVAAIVFEEVVQGVWRSYMRRLMGERRGVGRVLTILERVVGYAWVVFWLFWSIPKGLYGEMYCYMTA